MQDHLAKSRSLFRSFLRAASYLPDNFARAYIHKHVVLRFRNSLDKQKSRANKNPECSKGLHITTNELSINRAIAKGQKKLNVLIRAAQGGHECLTKVLMIVHGRIGRRKRELIKQLLEDDSDEIPGDTTALEAMLNDNRDRKFNLDGLLARPKLHSFICSQHLNQEKDVRGTIKTTTPKIPKENIWGRTMPLKRVESIKRCWWASTLKNILPPLPRDEFERLKGLSNGKIPLTAIPPRRSPAKPLYRSNDKEDGLQLIQMLRAPLRKIDELQINSIKCTSKGLEMKHDTSVAQSQSQYWLEKKIRCPRSMRRLYGKIWSLTSTISEDVNTGKWIVEWGHGSSKFMSGQVIRSHPRDAELFEGLEKFYVPSALTDRKKGRPSSHKAATT
ncbi:unnamed protein product [Blumeria hordei]|uniref:LYR motif-containing protein Cup1-like N-terminal domain-containing protein n=2 Tax=Blumeria hordei TaxID=2867405 RepID=A0A383UHZ8_BLUHO|nr:hypothetical protein BGHDH14_bgh03961 [Blumeria hordei DH14]SZE99451.1 unnamed protein product [Blumeria hordei]